MRFFSLALLFAASAAYAQEGVMLTYHLARDSKLTADPNSAVWKGVKGVVTDHDRYGKTVPGARTEIRSRWTDDNLYFLFISNYESQHLKPSPSTAETVGMWDFDVVEVFVGWDEKNPNRYKEFEVSPQNEWVDLDIDRSKMGNRDAWKWNSDFKYLSRVDKDKKIWYCEMQIPWKSIEERPVKAGNELRLNLYRIEGAPPNRKYITWRPVNSQSFHTPEAFGKLRLVKQ